MERDEALVRLEEIGNIIRSSNRFIYSGGTTIGYGIGFLLLPLINHLISIFSLTNLFSNYLNPSFVYTIFTLLGFVVVYLGGYVADKIYPPKCLQTPHPAIVKAFSIWKPIMISIFGVAYLLSAKGHGDVVFPVCLILLGVGHNLIGRFSLYVIEQISWVYIVAAFLMIMIGEKQLLIPSHHFFFGLLGVTYIYMGIMLNKQFKK